MSSMGRSFAKENEISLTKDILGKKCTSTQSFLRTKFISIGSINITQRTVGQIKFGRPQIRDIGKKTFR